MSTINCLVKMFLSLFALCCFTLGALVPVAATYISKLYPKLFIAQTGFIDPGLGITGLLVFILLIIIGVFSIATASEIK